MNSDKIIKKAKKIIQATNCSQKEEMFYRFMASVLQKPKVVKFGI